MKKFRGLVATLLAVAMVCSSLVIVSAKSFADVDAKKYDWCVKEISTMADDGIITGYTDGNFKPENTVTKLESLALVARVLGSRDEVNSVLVEKAKEIYGEKVDEYNLSFGQEELCFLLAKGIITLDELPDYVDDGAASSGMKRYDMAILLTKGMGAEKEVAEKVTAVLDYTDALKIPASARKYVEYVTTAGLMQGMGENVFSPMSDVTRAQAAVVLYKLKNLTGYEMFKGVVASYDSSTREIRFRLPDDSNKGYTIIPSTVALRCDGEEIVADAIKPVWEAIVTLKDGMLFAIDFLSTQSDGIVEGKLVAIQHNTGVATLKVEDVAGGNGDVASYKVADDCAVTYNGEESNISKIKNGEFVRLTIKNNKAIIINAEPAKKTVSGNVTAIDLSDGIRLTVKVGNLEYVYAIKSTVKVSKNGDVSNMSEIVVGDRVKLTLGYNIIESIEASSTTSAQTGIILGVIISDTPTLKIKIGSQVKEYPIARNVKILLDKTEGTIYDLRLNSNASITLESDSVVKIVTTPAVEEAEVKGVVVGVNVSYNLIQVKYVDVLSGAEHIEQVFVKSGAKIISTSSTVDKKLKDVEIGQTVTAMGSRSTGVFEATTVIIRN